MDDLASRSPAAWDLREIDKSRRLSSSPNCVVQIMNIMDKYTQCVSVGKATVTPRLWVELGLYGMHLAMSLLFWITSHRIRHSADTNPKLFKGRWGWKALWTQSERKFIFHLKSVLLKTIHPLCCSTRGIQHFSPFIWYLSTTLQIVLWGNFLLHVIWTFFPCPDKWCCQQRLLHFRAGKLCFWPDSLLGIQLEKKHDNIF